MSRKFWTGKRLKPPVTGTHDHCILVVPTNVEGRSGAGLAKFARDNWGAKYGQVRGLSGQCYLLPTKNLTPNYRCPETGVLYKRAGKRSLTPDQIRDDIRELYKVAASMPDKHFLVPYQKWDKNLLCGYSPREVFIMFYSERPPENIVFHESWRHDCQYTPEHYPL